jgi:hypothetical protein
MRGREDGCRMGEIEEEMDEMEGEMGEVRIDSGIVINVQQ